MKLKTLSQFVEIAKGKKTIRLVVAAAADHHVLVAVRDAKKEGIINPILVGDRKIITKISKEISFDLKEIEIIDIANSVKAAQLAVTIISNGGGEILMKGMVSTGPLLKAVLDKERGLRKEKVLSHIAFFESPYYHKIFGITDAAMNITPDLNEKLAIVKNAVEAFHKLGVKIPRVAVIGAVEVVNPKMEATVHAAALTQMNRRGQIKNCIIDGPLALDNAVSKESAEHKGIRSYVAGECDIILVPDINSGNILYKSIAFIGGGVSASVVMGAKVPIVLTSRSDSEKSKFLSIALAAAITDN